MEEERPARKRVRKADAQRRPTEAARNGARRSAHPSGKRPVAHKRTPVQGSATGQTPTARERTASPKRPTRADAQPLHRPKRRTQEASRTASTAHGTARPRKRSASNQHSSQQHRQQRPKQQQKRRTQNAAYPAKDDVRRDPRHASHAAPRRAFIPTPLLVTAAVALVVLGVCGWGLFGLLTRFTVTVNGQEVKVSRGSTVQTLIDKGYVSPTPGNLLAVDGSLLEEGKGAVCTATIDGKEAAADSPLSRNNTVQVDDGGDLTEDTTTTEEELPFKQAESNYEYSAYWSGSIHLMSKGENGVKEVRTGKISGKTIEEVTKPAVDAGYLIYTAKPEDKVIALTFDDGPWKDSTSDILDILEEYDAKATFFTIGNQIAYYPDQVKRAAEMGCQICTHTWDHADGSGGGSNLSKMSEDEQIEEVQKGFAAIEDVLGEEPAHIMRAPGGNFYGDCITNLWDYVDAEIGWDVDTEDWSRPGSDSILQMILSVQPGQVILMHDGGGDRSQTVEALREAMPKLVEEGYSFVTIDELLAYGQPGTGDALQDIPSTTDA